MLWARAANAASTLSSRALRTVRYTSDPQASRVTANTPTAQSTRRARKLIIRRTPSYWSRSTYPAPRTVWISRGAPLASSLVRR